MDCVDYAMLAEDAYENGESLRIVARSRLSRIWRTADPTTGFACALYRREASRDCFLAYRGTSPTDWGDIVTDIGIGLRRLSPQFVQAMGSFGTASFHAGGDQHILGVCGHSLGGALAKFVAASRGKLCYSFNGPGISGMGGTTRQTDRGDIRNINAAGDVVSKYGARLGRTETVPVSSMRFVPDRMEGGVAAAAGLIGLGAYLLSQHSITNLRKKLASLQASERPFT